VLASPLGTSLRIAARRHLASRCHRVLPAGDVPLDLAEFCHVVALAPLQGFPFGVGTYVEVWGVAQHSSCLRGMTIVACTDAGFPKRYQRGSLVVM